MNSPFLLAILSACALLAIGVWLRARVRVIQILFIPASVVAGAIGFEIVQLLRMTPIGWRVSPIASDLASWPGPLIALVFAGLLLERPSSGSFTDAIRRGARSGTLAWIIILGQIAIGLLVYIVAVRPFDPTIPPTFGQLLEVSWAGGHGASSGMGQIYRAQGFGQGQDIAFFLATVGLIYGVTSGLVLVNLAVRRGWTHRSVAGAVPVVGGLDVDAPQPMAYARVRREIVDPLSMQIIILAAAFGVGFVLQQTFIAAASTTLQVVSPSAQARVMGFVGNIPLFLFTLLGGWIVREVMTYFNLGKLIDPPSIQRLLGAAMDFLIVAALTAMRVEAVTAFLLPIVLLVTLAGGWTIFCLLYLARKLLPKDYWFELGLLNYGFATANTPQGFMLLRIVDPDLTTPAAEDYAVAAPLSAPFVGGGFITFLGLPLLLEFAHPVLVLILCLAMLVGLYYLGLQLRTVEGSAKGFEVV